MSQAISLFQATFLQYIEEKRRHRLTPAEARKPVREGFREEHWQRVREARAFFVEPEVGTIKTQE